MKKRLFSCLLAALLLTSAMVSCGTSETNPEETTSSAATSVETVPETEAETEPPYPKYDKNYGGADFNMLYYDAVAACGWGNTIPCDIYVEELTGEILSDAVFQRNAAVEELYNIKIGAQGLSNGDYSLIEQQVVAATTEYDVFFPVWQSVAPMVSKNLLTDLTGVFDFTQPWYDSKAQNAFSILGKSYATISDAHYMDKMLSIVILYNKQMAADYQMGDLYQTVLDGNWTFDMMHGMCETVAADLDGDGKFTKADRYGIINQNDGVYQLYQSSGEQYCRMDADGVPSLTIGGERAVAMFQKVYDFLNETNLFFNRQTHGVNTVEVCNMFAANNALFIMRQIQCAFELRGMEADFGIIPTPKMTDDQEDYYTSIGYTVALCEAIPAVVKDAEMSAIVLDTLAAEGHYNVNPALYDTVLGEKLARDEASKANLDLIFDNRVYDPGCVFNFGDITLTMMNSFTKGSGQVASLIAGQTKAVEKSIEKFLEGLLEG